MHQRLLQYGDFSVLVNTSDRSLLEWLQEFLSPSFRMTTGQQADWSVRVDKTREQFDTLLHNPSQKAPREVDCFTRDGHFLRFPVWEEDDRLCTVYDDHCRCFYRVDRRGRTVTMVCDGENHLTRRALARLVRELATIHCLRRGDVPVHAAAFARDGVAFVMAGPRRAGKTTFLTSELIEGNAQLIANDRVMLRSQHNTTIARGMPTIIKLRSNTVDMFPRLAMVQSVRTYHREYLLKEAQPTVSRNQADHSAKLSTAQYCDLAGCQAVGARPLASLMFPELSDGADKTQFLSLGSEEACELLFDSMFLSAPPLRMASLFCESDENYVDGTRLRKNCAAIVQSVHCYRVLVAQRTPQLSSTTPLAVKAA